MVSNKSRRFSNMSGSHSIGINSKLGRVSDKKNQKTKTIRNDVTDSQRLSNKSGRVSKSSGRVSTVRKELKYARGYFKQVKVSRKTFRYVSKRQEESQTLQVQPQMSQKKCHHHQHILKYIRKILKHTGKD